MSLSVMDGYTALFVGGALLVAIVAMGVAFRSHAQALVGTRRDALTDTLTGLGNRRKLFEDLEDALSGPDAPRLLVVFDLDGFKAYNDVFGHPAGDALLARLGRRIEAALPPHARAYRLGGDEFCALVDDRGSEYDAIVAAVARSLSESGDGVTASHGMIAMPREADSPERALQLADRRLYADKSVHHGSESGREVRDALTEALQQRSATPEGFDPVTELAGRVARRMGLWGEELELVVRAAELHEVGKAAIPEAILRKPHPLDDAERALLSHHTLVGERMLSSAEALSPVARLVRACDERWDGDGRPDGLTGRKIPLGARIVAVCEAFHLLSTPGPDGGEGEPRRAALLRLRQDAGSRFDPEVVEAFVAATEPEATPDGESGGASARGARAGMLAALVLGTLLLLPGSALAGTVTLSSGKLDLKASPGQANKLTITAGSGDQGNGALVKEEGPGATLTAGQGCTLSAPGQVHCSLPSSISIDTGDGNDSVVTYTWIPVSLKGGPGDDALYGSGGKDTLDGGDGNDTLGGGFGGDSIKGGPGNDTVTYSYFTFPVAVSLDGAANDGIQNDHSNVASDVENVIGGQGADTLTGNALSNMLDGGPGRDVLRADGGDDTIRARDGERDDVGCGGGHDTVTADNVDTLARDCDSSVATPRLQTQLLSAGTPVSLQSSPVRVTRKGVAPIQLRCLSKLAGRCRGTITLDLEAASAKKASASRTGRGQAIGKARFSVKSGGTAVLKVHISRNGRRRVLRRRKLRCRASLAVRRSDGSRATVVTTLTLIAPKGGS
jgi:diguanylate cyclase (GGDEF)-like protein